MEKNETFVVVGSAKNMTLHPKRCDGGFISIYRVTEGKQFELIHKVSWLIICYCLLNNFSSKLAVENGPTALCCFQDGLLVGLGTILRFYTFGKKKLVLKCEKKV